MEVVVPLDVEVLPLRSALVVALSVPEVPELVMLSVGVVGGSVIPLSALILVNVNTLFVYGVSPFSLQSFVSSDEEMINLLGSADVTFPTLAPSPGLSNTTATWSPNEQYLSTTRFAPLL